MSKEEYLEVEQRSIDKNEYFDGEMLPATIYNVQGNIVGGNILHTIKKAALQRFGHIFYGNQRICIPANNAFLYPTILIVTDEIKTLNDDEYNILNPSIIIDTIAPPIRNNSRSGKFKLYRDIPTLKEYIVVNSESIFIEAFHINERNHWEQEEYKTKDAVLSLLSIGIKIPVSEIYEGTQF